MARYEAISRAVPPCNGASNSTSMRTKSSSLRDRHLDARKQTAGRFLRRHGDDDAFFWRVDYAIVNLYQRPDDPMFRRLVPATSPPELVR